MRLEDHFDSVSAGARRERVRNADSSSYPSMPLESSLSPDLKGREVETASPRRNGPSQTSIVY